MEPKQSEQPKHAEPQKWYRKLSNKAKAIISSSLVAGIIGGILLYYWPQISPKIPPQIENETLSMVVAPPIQTENSDIPSEIESSMFFEPQTESAFSESSIDAQDDLYPIPTPKSLFSRPSFDRLGGYMTAGNYGNMTDTFTPMLNQNADTNINISRLNPSFINTKLNDYDTSFHTFFTQNALNFTYTINNIDNALLTINKVFIKINKYEKIDTIHGIFIDQGGAGLQTPVYYYCNVNPYEELNLCYIFDYDKYWSDYSDMSTDGTDVEMIIQDYYLNGSPTIDGNSPYEYMIFANLLQEGIYNISVQVECQVGTSSMIIESGEFEFLMIHEDRFADFCIQNPSQEP